MKQFSPKSVIIIPSRWGSKRLPGKPLVEIAGKPLISWVIKVALESKEKNEVIVATDNNEIYELSIKYGANAIMTNANHANGTSRLIEVSELLQADFYINLQGDEPLINPIDLDQIIQTLKRNPKNIVSLCHKIKKEEAKSNSKVKVVFTSNQKALYFSRAIIPHNSKTIYQHCGIYGFSKENLQIIKTLESTKLEEYEDLEQLRWLESGLHIQMIITNTKTQGVDTIEDIKEVDKKLRLKNIKAIITDI